MASNSQLRLAAGGALLQYHLVIEEAHDAHRQYTFMDGMRESCRSSHPGKES